MPTRDVARHPGSDASDVGVVPRVVLVMGAPGPSLDLVDGALVSLGLRSLRESPDGRGLAELNDRVLAELAGSRERLPEVDAGTVARLAGSEAPAALSVPAEVVDLVTGTPSVAPWVWTDSALSILAPFWASVLGSEAVAAVMVHHGGTSSETGVWDAYTRAALVQVSEHPSAIVVCDVGADPKAQVESLAKLVAHCGLEVTPSRFDDAVRQLEDVTGAGTAPQVDHGGAARPTQLLAALVRGLQGFHPTPHWDEQADLAEDMAKFYDEDYYETSCSGYGGVPYRWDEPHWIQFFTGIAERIIDTLHPGTVLDAGCAIGLLVASLRRRGVDARGFDVSPWAIAQVPDDARPFCAVASITDEITGHYDLITCIEVVEHLPAFMAESAIANLCRHTDAVLLSTTADDFAEPTHLNVRGGGYWASIFLQHGFVRDPDYDAGFLSPQAVLLRRRQSDLGVILDTYERALANTTHRLLGQLEAGVHEHERLAERFTTLARRQSSDTLAAQDVMAEAARSQEHLSEIVERTRAELEALRNTRSYRYTDAPRRVYGRVRRLRARAFPSTVQQVATPVPSGGSYSLWVETYDTLDDAGRARIRSRIAALDTPPLFSVIMPVYNPRPSYLRAAIDSVVAQLYPHWELCIADDCSTDPEVGAVLDECARKDDKIRITRRPDNGHISAATNSAVALARGEWLCFLDHDDAYAEHALATVALELSRRPHAGLLYSDEDKIDGVGRRQEPYFKPDFDPLLLLGQNYMTHLLAVRRDLFEGVGRMREGFEGSQDWDLVLRVSERLQPTDIVHVPHVLYHWRAHEASTAATIATKPYAATAGQRAVTEHLDRLDRPAQVSRIAVSGHNRVRWPIPDPAPLVSIIIPTRDGRYLDRCIDSILSFTNYPNFEIVVVDNGSRSRGTLRYLEARAGQLRIIRDDRPFNFSALNNAAAAQVRGSILCLLNDDTETGAATWLDELVGQLMQPGVGAVGAKLLYSDGRVQHGGVILGIGGVAGHAHRMADRLSPGYMGRLLVAQSLSAVTAACMVVRREAWEQVGGLNEEQLAVAFNDVDFCIRLGEAGWRIVWTPDAELIHHESVSRGPETSRPAEFAAEIDYMQTRWGPELRNDPAYNPNLTLLREDWAPAWPPRIAQL